MAFYATVGPTAVEVPGSCAFLGKCRLGRAKNSRSRDQTVSRKWCERMASHWGEGASIPQSQAAREGREQGRVWAAAG